MLQRLICTNFRGFRALDTRVELVTAFLGPNSSGKTTALHAIRFACDALRLAIDAESPARVDDAATFSILVVEGMLVEHVKLLPLADWRALFVDQAVGENVTLSVTLVFEASDPIAQIDVKLICARNAQLKLDVRVRSQRACEAVEGLPRKSPQIAQRLAQFLSDHSPVAVFVPPFYGTVREEEYRGRANIDKMLGAGDQSHVVRNLVVGLEPEQFERLNAFLRETIGARITQRTGRDDAQRVTQLSVQFRDSNGDIELSAAGAGLVNLIALYSALSRWRSESKERRVLFLLDEPEAHLHPRLQADMTERLARLVTQEFGAQLLLATHSVDILNRLASSGGALLLRCDRAATPSVVGLSGDSELFDDLAPWVDLTPFTAINFLASRRVAFCEGKDELALLPRLAETRYRNDPRRLDAFRRWALVELPSASNAPIADLLARLVRHDVVRSRATTQEAFRVAVVLDRDHGREPGTRDREHDGVLEHTVVWSQHSVESLMLEPSVLTAWIRALVKDAAPPNLPERVAAAITAANNDATLNRLAIQQLAAKLAFSDLRDESDAPLTGERKFVHAQRRAEDLVTRAPAVWQRGKDRAKVVLGLLRPSISLPARNQFPTDLIALACRADPNLIGDPTTAIPAEAAALLDFLATP